MAIPSFVFRAAGQIVFNFRSRKRTFEDLGHRLGKSGTALRDRLESLEASEANIKKLRHIIGIERWGQNRLNSFLTGNFEMDTYHGYKPSKELSWTELRELFSRTRAESLAIVRNLNSSAKEIAPFHVVHNQFGGLSAKGWLLYLDVHANAESDRLK